MFVEINWKAKGMNQSRSDPGSPASGWEHLTADELRLLDETFFDPASWMTPFIEGDFVEPILGWSVVYPHGDTLAELLFRDETSARQAAAAIPNAVVSNFSTPDATWHHWQDRA